MKLQQLGFRFIYNHTTYYCFYLFPSFFFLFFLFNGSSPKGEYFTDISIYRWYNCGHWWQYAYTCKSCKCIYGFQNKIVHMCILFLYIHKHVIICVCMLTYLWIGKYVHVYLFLVRILSDAKSVSILKLVRSLSKAID